MFSFYVVYSSSFHKPSAFACVCTSTQNTSSTYPISEDVELRAEGLRQGHRRITGEGCQALGVHRRAEQLREKINTGICRYVVDRDLTWIGQPRLSGRNLTWQRQQERKERTPTQRWSWAAQEVKVNLEAAWAFRKELHRRKITRGPLPRWAHAAVPPFFPFPCCGGNRLRKTSQDNTSQRSTHPSPLLLAFSS